MSSTIEQADNATVSLFGNGGMPHTRMARPARFPTRPQPEQYILAVIPTAQTAKQDLFQRNVEAALYTVLATAKATLAAQQNETAVQTPEQTPFEQRPREYVLAITPAAEQELFQRNMKEAVNTILATAIEVQAKQKADQISTAQAPASAQTSSERDTFFSTTAVQTPVQAPSKPVDGFLSKARKATFFTDSCAADEQKGQEKAIEKAIQHVNAITI